MKIKTPEISWHAKEAIYSVDIQPVQEGKPRRLATAGIDSNVRIWELKPDSKTGIAFLSNLARHERAVNVVRFSKCGKTLASGGDDGTVVLWQLSDRNDAPNIFEDETNMGKNVEYWNAHKVLRGHIEDVNDLSWSEDGNILMSGSIDHTAIIWDVSKASKIVIMSEAKHFIHGVAYDPLGEYAASLAGDRSMRIYNLKTNRVIHNVCKMCYPTNSEVKIDEEEVVSIKAQRMFHDESVVRRRLAFTPDGSLLIVPSGSLNRKRAGQVEQINTAYVFTRSCFSKPAIVLPGFKQPVTVIRCCPVKFSLRESSNSVSDSVVTIPYRLIFAIASSDTILLYDSQTFEPFSVISNVHYAAITDMAWSPDARQLVISSRDGFCTIVYFDEKELGDAYSEEAIDTVTLFKAQEAMDIDNNINMTPSENTVSDNPGTDTKASATLVKPEPVEVQNVASNIVLTTKECNKVETTCAEIEKDISISSQEKSTPRRIQLTTISNAPVTPKPRRVQLTTLSSGSQNSSKEKTPSRVAKICNGSPASSGISPKSSKKEIDEKKKTPRRIQLTPVD